MNETVEKIIIFEEINAVFNPIMKKHIKNNSVIYFFKIDAKYRNDEEIKDHLRSGKIIDIAEITSEYHLLRSAQIYAHENIDNIFDKHYAPSASIKVMGRLLRSPEIIDMYKKELSSS